jgi:hypothetical protein
LGHCGFLVESRTNMVAQGPELERDTIRILPSAEDRVTVERAVQFVERNEGFLEQRQSYKGLANYTSNTLASQEGE